MSIRAVIDTSVFFEAFYRLVCNVEPGSPFIDILDAGVNNEYVALWSGPTLGELKYMLIRSAKARQYDFPANDPEDVIDILLRGERVYITGCAFEVGPDRTDDKFVETAIVGGAEFLVAADYRHFHRSDVKAFLASLGCTVTDAAGFLAILNARISPR
jgi:predicted nucleic acid-binding protein